MKLFTFTSQSRAELHAFAADSGGSKLPAKFGPWSATGVIRQDQNPPHHFPRNEIEDAIENQGFQLWRMKKPAAKDGGAAH